MFAGQKWLGTFRSSDFVMATSSFFVFGSSMTAPGSQYCSSSVVNADAKGFGLGMGERELW